MDAHFDSRGCPIKVSLQKARNYSWDIWAAGSSVDEILAIIKDADAKLQAEYGERNEGA